MRQPSLGRMQHLSTPLLLKIGAAMVAIGSIAATVGGWLAIGVVDATLVIGPEVRNAAEPSAEVIAVIDRSLDEINRAMETLGAITGRVADSTDEAADILDEVAALSTGQIPDTLISLREALPALIDTARVIDDTMRTLSVLGVQYRPQVPLDEAFGEVQANLEGLPETISDQGVRLGSLVTEMRTTGQETRTLTDQVGVIADELEEAQTRLASYEEAFDSLARISSIGDRVSRTLPFARVALVVLGISGLALGVLGWNLADRIQQDRPKRDAATMVPEDS